MEDILGRRQGDTTEKVGEVEDRRKKQEKRRIIRISRI